MAEQEALSDRDRHMVLLGRIKTVQEVLQLTSDLGDRIDVHGTDEDNLPILVQNWRDLHKWLEQARDEVVTEVKLLKQ